MTPDALAGKIKSDQASLLTSPPAGGCSASCFANATAGLAGRTVNGPVIAAAAGRGGRQEAAARLRATAEPDAGEAGRLSRSQLALLRAHGIRPVKRRGQNFLLDANLARAIAAEVLALGTRVLELGAGAGALAAPLLAAGAAVTAVEVDRQLCALLRAELGSSPGFRLLEEDLTRLDWPAVLDAAGPRPVVAGNLPYVLTSSVLLALAEWRQGLAGAVLMVQREVAERMTAAPGGRTYGVLAALLGALFEIRALRRVPPEVFWPRPEVESAVVRLVPAGPPWPPAELAHYRAVVKTLFARRRKQLGSALRAGWGMTPADAAATAAAAGLDPAQRPEQIAPAGLRALAAQLPGEAAP